MDIEYRAQVVDRDGNFLGKVDYIMRNTWTGEVSKFMVRREPPEVDLFLSQPDIVETTKSTIKLSVSSEELHQKSEP